MSEVIEPATEQDLIVIHQMIEELADHLGLSHQVVVTAENLRLALFGPRPDAEVLVGRVDGETAGFALFYGNYSTFRGVAGFTWKTSLCDRPFVAPGWGAGCCQPSRS